MLKEKSGIGAPVGILGVILPIYTIIDMVETAENVWSDSCVCAMVDRNLGRLQSAENWNSIPQTAITHFYRQREEDFGVAINLILFGETCVHIAIFVGQ